MGGPLPGEWEVLVEPFSELRDPILIKKSKKSRRINFESNIFSGFLEQRDPSIQSDFDKNFWFSMMCRAILDSDAHGIRSLWVAENEV